MSNISTDLQDVEKIIVDYGSQYNQLISRRSREIAFFRAKSHKISAAEVQSD